MDDGLECPGTRGHRRFLPLPGMVVFSWRFSVDKPFRGVGCARGRRRILDVAAMAGAFVLVPALGYSRNHDEPVLRFRSLPLSHGAPVGALCRGRLDRGV